MSKTDMVNAPDGTRLLLRSWEASDASRASVVIVHGLGEHSGRYEHVGAYLADQGFTVFAMDLRGFGGSDGRRAFVKEFSEFYLDVQVGLDRAAVAGRPVALLGHSLGGLVALRYLQEGGKADLLVLSSPSVDAEIPAAKRIAARVLRRIVPGLSLPNDLTGEQLSRDPAVGEAYFADALVCTKTTAALGGAMLDAMASARAGLVPPPALIIHGEDDPIVPARISAPLAEHEGVTRTTFPGFRHESFNEEGGVRALEVVTAWIEGQLAQAS